MLFAIFDGDRIVAAANLTAGPDAATDVGIVVHPDERGKGFAMQVRPLAARQALLMHGIARFRALATSSSTMAIAQKLGFEEYGRNLAVYLETVAAGRASEGLEHDHAAPRVGRDEAHADPLAQRKLARAAGPYRWVVESDCSRRRSRFLFLELRENHA